MNIVETLCVHWQIVYISVCLKLHWLFTTTISVYIIFLLLLKKITSIFAFSCEAFGFTLGPKDVDSTGFHTGFTLTDVACAGITSECTPTS